MSRVGITLAVDDKGSPVVKRFTDKTVDRVKQMSDRSTQHVEQMSAKFRQRLGGAITKVGGMLTNLQSLAVGALAGWGVTSLANGFLQVGKRMDDMRVSLDTITQGQGEEWFRRLNEWAMKMPVNTERAIDSFKRMRAMGLDPSIDQMTVLVDTMSALGGQADTLDGISRALGQISTKGKVSAEELMQLAERGVPVFEILKQKFGEVETSSLDANQAIRAIFEGMEERFGGQSQIIQKKWSGLVETLKSYWTDFRRLVMDSGVMEYLETRLGSFLDKIEEMRSSGDFRKYAQDLADRVVSSIDSILEAGKNLVDFWQDFGGKIKSVTIEMGKFYAISKTVAGATAIVTFFKGLAATTAGLTAQTVALNTALKSSLPVLAAYASYKVGEWMYDKSTGLDQIKQETEEMRAVQERLEARLADARANQRRLADKPAGTSSAGKSAVDFAREQIQSMIQVARQDKKLLSERLTEYEKFYDELGEKIRKNAELEKKHIKELTALHEQKMAVRKNSEEMILKLRQSQMSEPERYESQKQALEQQYYNALQMSGQDQVKALEQYKQDVMSFANTYSNGVEETARKFGETTTRVVASARQVVEDSVQNIKWATEEQKTALESLSMEKQQQIEEDRIWGESLQNTATEVESEIQDLQGTIAGLSRQIEEADKVIDISAEDNATSVVRKVQQEMARLHDKTVYITTVHRSVGQGSSSGMIPEKDGNAGFGASNSPGNENDNDNDNVLNPFASDFSIPPNIKGSYRYGTNYVPATGLYRLHQGEKVSRSGKETRQPAQIGDIHINIPESAAPQDPADWREITRNYIKPELERMS